MGLMKNKKANMYAAVMVAIVLFMIGMIIVNFLKPEVTTARASLNCAAPTEITDGTKIMCLVVDTTVIYWMVLVFSIAGGLITEKVLI